MDSLRHLVATRTAARPTLRARMERAGIARLVVTLALAAVAVLALIIASPSFPRADALPATPRVASAATEAEGGAVRISAFAARMRRPRARGGAGPKPRTRVRYNNQRLIRLLLDSKRDARVLRKLAHDYGIDVWSTRKSTSSSSSAQRQRERVAATIRSHAGPRTRARPRRGRIGPRSPSEEPEDDDEDAESASVEMDLLVCDDLLAVVRERFPEAEYHTLIPDVQVAAVGTFATRAFADVLADVATAPVLPGTTTAFSVVATSRASASWTIATPVVDPTPLPGSSSSSLPCAGQPPPATSSRVAPRRYQSASVTSGSPSPSPTSTDGDGSRTVPDPTATGSSSTTTETDTATETETATDGGTSSTTTTASPRPEPTVRPALNWTSAGAAANLAGRYLNFTDMKAYLARLAAAKPDLVTVASMGKSYEGRDLLWARLTAPPVRDLGSMNVSGVTVPKTGKPAIFFSGGLHAREWIAPSVLLNLLDVWAALYGTDPHVTALLDTYELIIAPMLNPDGYEYSFAFDRLWRKNTEVYADECMGVDINRNFPTDEWSDPLDLYASSPDACDDTFRGTAPGSSPEATAIVNFVTAFQRETGGALQFALDTHSYSLLWMYPYGYNCEDSFPAQPRLAKAAVAGADGVYSVHGMEFVTGDVCKTIYPTSGSGTDWMFQKANVTYSFAVELRDIGEYGFLLPPEQILPSVEEMHVGVLAAIASMAASEAESTTPPAP
ncbi:hypothetical protein H9P43_002080 [Blastocladiella emersonii ATCC 22665]|nr:hypothetical protein H9P43_002080 [Blastocladiella emersonii ATCC 22665]